MSTWGVRPGESYSSSDTSQMQDGHVPEPGPTAPSLETIKESVTEFNADQSRLVPLVEDPLIAGTWLYPENVPFREYQRDIAHKALFRNTLVCLPTGLGKTLIAAVVMFNFYRWYPQGKVVFMAPTKPLVAQQIEACYNIMGIPRSDTCELTGSKDPEARRTLWQTKRVFFVTAQSMISDINRGTCPLDSVVCVVVDEAHKATKNYAYVLVVKEIAQRTANFRVLALSATPGRDLDAVATVIKNLRIAHIEVRDESDEDVRKYLHGRAIETIKIATPPFIQEVNALFLEVLRQPLQRLTFARACYMVAPEHLTRHHIISRYTPHSTLYAMLFSS